MSEWTIDLPLTRPLSLNDRQHWAPLAQRVGRLRKATAAILRAKHIPPLGRCEVWLHYAPRDRRRRDADNLTPTLKAACDGIVDAGIVTDDTPDLMVKHMPVIEPPTGGRQGRIWLRIARLP